MTVIMSSFLLSLFLYSKSVQAYYAINDYNLKEGKTFSGKIMDKPLEDDYSYTNTEKHNIKIKIKKSGIMKMSIFMKAHKSWVEKKVLNDEDGSYELTETHYTGDMSCYINPSIKEIPDVRATKTQDKSCTKKIKTEVYKGNEYVVTVSGWNCSYKIKYTVKKPKSNSINSFKKKKGVITVKWKKGVDAIKYECQISTNKTFKTNTYRIKTKKRFAKFKGKRGKRYYIRIRYKRWWCYGYKITTRWSKVRVLS